MSRYSLVSFLLEDRAAEWQTGENESSEKNKPMYGYFLSVVVKVQDGNPVTTFTVGKKLIIEVLHK